MVAIQERSALLKAEKVLVLHMSRSGKLIAWDANVPMLRVSWGDVDDVTFR
jgi:hypothetical protein